MAEAIAGGPIPREVVIRDLHWEAVEAALAAEHERQEGG
jgi:hypothetical protein